MNAAAALEVDLGDIIAEVEVEQEKEEKEKTICARLLFTKEQLEAPDEETKKDDNDVTVLNEVFPKLYLTKEQESDLLEAFNLLDHTGEGKINGNEFRVVVKALGYEPTKEELMKMVNAVDKGYTGKMSFENFQTAIMRKIMATDSDRDIIKSFRMFDMDDEGAISFENLKAVTEILGIYLTDEEIDQMMDDADKDMDGVVSLEEFMKTMKNTVDIQTL